MNPTRRNFAESLVHHIGVLTIACLIACFGAVVGQAAILGGVLAAAATIVMVPLTFFTVLAYLWFALPLTYLLAPLWLWAAKTGIWGQLAAIALTPVVVFAAIATWAPPAGAYELAYFTAAMVGATAAIYYALEPRFS